MKGRGEESHREHEEGKTAGCSGLPIDIIKHLGKSGVDMMHEILKRVWEEENMPEEWTKSEIVPTYMQKGDPLECGNFRGSKLLENRMTMSEEILERSLRKLITTTTCNLDLVQGKVQQMQYLSYNNCKKTSRTAQGFLLYLRRYEKS